jgi:hypothetical protein
MLDIAILDKETQKTAHVTLAALRNLTDLTEHGRLQQRLKGLFLPAESYPGPDPDGAGWAGWAEAGLHGQRLVCCIPRAPVRTN